MGTHWTDLDVQGRKVTRLIRLMEKKLQGCRSDEKIIRYANSIGFLISKHIEIIKYRYSVDDFIKEWKVRKTRYDKDRRFKK